MQPAHSQVANKAGVSAIWENPPPLRFKIQQTLDGSKLVQSKAFNGQLYARGQQASLWFQEIGMKALSRRRLMQ
jgi:hypothetical protein